MTEFTEGILTLVQSGSLLTPREIAVALLAHIRKADPHARQCKRLAQDLRVNRPSISRAVDTLVKAGLGKRSCLPEDRRTAVLTLTAKGEKFVVGLVEG